MPLHDWAQLPGWNGVHTLWMGKLITHLKARLPAGYRAFLSTGPGLAVGAPSIHPDIAVRAAPDRPAQDSPETASRAGGLEPDVEVVATAMLDAVPALFVERSNRLVAAVEIVSPRNKDRPSAREVYRRRYASYLMDGVHLVLVDVLPTPRGFSFARVIEEECGVPDPAALPAPFAVSYRSGEELGDGKRFLAIWRRPLACGRPLPEIALPLSVHEAVPIDLEATYMAAADDAYINN